MILHLWPLFAYFGWRFAKGLAALVVFVYAEHSARRLPAGRF